MAQSPKGGLIQGVYKPIHGNCTIYCPGVILSHLNFAISSTLTGNNVCSKLPSSSNFFSLWLVVTKIHWQKKTKKTLAILLHFPCSFFGGNGEWVQTFKRDPKTKSVQRLVGSWWPPKRVKIGDPGIKSSWKSMDSKQLMTPNRSSTCSSWKP